MGGGTAVRKRPGVSAQTNKQITSSGVQISFQTERGGGERSELERKMTHVLDLFIKHLDSDTEPFDKGNITAEKMD